LKTKGRESVTLRRNSGQLRLKLNELAHTNAEPLAGSQQMPDPTHPLTVRNILKGLTVTSAGYPPAVPHVSTHTIEFRYAVGDPSAAMIRPAGGYRYSSNRPTVHNHHLASHKTVPVAHHKRGVFSQLFRSSQTPGGNPKVMHL
jgi:hypothetical protein